MADKVKLVAESLNEWKDDKNESRIDEQVQQLNEGAKGLLQKFIKNPENTKLLTAAFARQLGKVKGLKDVLVKLSDESKVKVAQQALKALTEDPKKGYPWLKVQGNKIVGAGALGVQSKPGIHKSTGVD